MRLVILESPFAAVTEYTFGRNLAYARRCVRDCLLREDAPFASHLLYTQDGVLDDANKDERALGIEAGLLWGQHANATLVYVDLGVSPGMHLGIERAVQAGRL